jgi:cellular retinoic acid-binding protein 2
MEAFKGTYERTSAENYEDMLKLLDVNMLLRKAACASTPKMEVSDAGGVWTIKTSTTLKTMELKFKLGEQFDETTPDGREVTAVVNLDGGKIVTVQKAKKDGEKSTKSVREMNGTDEMIYTMTIDGSDLVCVQKFKRI